MTLTNNPFTGITDSIAKQNDITAITQASIERSAGTVVRAKNGEGNVKAVLIGKEQVTMQVQGYSEVDGGAKLGDEIMVSGITGKVISSSIEASVEDFQKFSAQGRALKVSN